MRVHLACFTAMLVFVLTSGLIELMSNSSGDGYEACKFYRAYLVFLTLNYTINLVVLLLIVYMTYKLIVTPI